MAEGVVTRSVQTIEKEMQRRHRWRSPCSLLRHLHLRHWQNQHNPLLRCGELRQCFIPSFPRAAPPSRPLPDHHNRDLYLHRVRLWTTLPRSENKNRLKRTKWGRKCVGEERKKWNICNWAHQWKTVMEGLYRSDNRSVRVGVQNWGILGWGIIPLPHI